jgi:hypothetical protein
MQARSSLSTIAVAIVRVGMEDVLGAAGNFAAVCMGVEGKDSAHLFGAARALETE